jgi:hypothetical protein
LYWPCIFNPFLWTLNKVWPFNPLELDNHKVWDTLSWQRPNSDPYDITTKWLAMNLKLPGTSHMRF